MTDPHLKAVVLPVEPARRRRVLVVEDDRLIVRFVSVVLDRAGHQAVVVANGCEALEHLRTAEALPDLILLDVMMPVMDGYAFRETQQADPRLASIPVVVMTASDLDGAPPGVAGTLNKPMSAAELLAVVDRHA